MHIWRNDGTSTVVERILCLWVILIASIASPHQHPSLSKTLASRIECPELRVESSEISALVMVDGLSRW